MITKHSISSFSSSIMNFPHNEKAVEGKVLNIP